MARPAGASLCLCTFLPTLLKGQEMPHSRRTRFIYLLLLVVLLVAANSALSPHSSVVASPPNYKSPFGIAGAMRWPDWSSFDRPADAVMQTGGAWVREDFAWSLIEPREGQQDWTATDRITRELG